MVDRPTKTDLISDWLAAERDLKLTEVIKPTRYLDKVIRPLVIGLKTLNLGLLSAKVVDTPIQDGADDGTIDNLAHSTYANVKIPEGLIKTVDGFLLLLPRALIPVESPWINRLVFGIPAALIFFASHPEFLPFGK